jgi:parallel beta-helix repeat protein
MFSLSQCSVRSSVIWHIVLGASLACFEPISGGMKVLVAEGSGAQQSEGEIVSPERLKQLFTELENGNAETRLAAIRAIRGHVDAKNLGTIFRLLKAETERSGSDSSVIYHLEQAIVEVKDPQAVEVLISFLSEEQRYLPYLVKSLAKFEDAKAIDAIFMVYDRKTTQGNFKLKPTIENFICDDIKGEYAKEVLMKRVVGGSFVAAQALERFPEPKVVDALVAALSNSEDLARQMCLRSLGRIRDPRAAPAVVKFLVDKAKWTRSRAAWALGEFRDPQTAAPLVQVIETETEPDVLICAVAALGQIGNPISLEPLQVLRQKTTDRDLQKECDGAIAAVRKAMQEPQSAAGIVSLPADGSTGVSVDTKLIRITFPEEMQTDSFSVVAASGGQKPETTGDEPYFFEDARTFVMNVKLAANTNYAFSLNSERWKGFKKANGEPLPPKVIRFSTSKGSSPTPQPPVMQGDLMVSASARGERQNEFRTINDALQAAKDGATVVVQPGVYRESLVLSRPVTLKAADSDSGEVVIESIEGTCVKMQTTQAALKGIKIRSAAAASGKTGFGVDCPGGTLTLESCDITSDTLGCVIVYNAGAKVLATNCRIHDGHEGGIFAYDNAESTYENCEISGCTLGNVETKTGAHPVFRNCRIHSGKQGGVYIHDNGAGLFENCEVRANALAGVEISLGGTPEFRDCRISDGSTSGIYVHDKGAGLFQDCDIFGNTYAGVEITIEGDPAFQNCRIHNGKSGGVYASKKGAGKFTSCDIYENAWAAVAFESESSPHLEDCRIFDNIQSGFYCFERGEGTLRNCEIYGNILAGVEINGGDPLLIECNIHDGKACGVSVLNQGKGRLSDCEMTNNGLSGLLVQSRSNPTLTDCRLRDNQQCGAGFYDGALGTLDSCEVSGNGHSGIEIAMKSDPTFRKCTVHDGKSSGAYVYKEGLGIFEDCEFFANVNVAIYIGDAGTPTVRHCTIRNGLASGVVSDATAAGRLIDCDIFGNTAPQVNAVAGSQLKTENCRIKEVEGGTSNPPDNQVLTESHTDTPRNLSDTVQTTISENAQLLAAAALKEAGAEVVMDDPENGGHCVFVDATGVADFDDELLVHVRNLPYLWRLTLSHTKVSDAGLENVRDLSVLLMLDLSGTAVTDAGMVHLRGLTSLEGLVLEDTKVTSAGMQHLSGLTHMAGLRFAGTQVDDEGLKALKDMPDVTVLDLGGTAVTDKGLEYLQHMIRMQELSLVGTKVGDRGLKHLAGMKELEILDLSFTQVADGGLAELCNMPKLIDLSLVETAVSDSGIMQLSDMRQLEKLNINLTQISGQAVERLQAKLPDTTIIWTEPVKESLSGLRRPRAGNSSISKSRSAEKPRFDHGLELAMGSLLRQRTQGFGSSGGSTTLIAAVLPVSGNGHDLSTSVASADSAPSGSVGGNGLLSRPKAAAPGEASIRSRMYSNPIAGFQIKIPADWEMATNVAGVTEISIDAQAGAGLRTQPALWFFHAPNPPDLQAQELQNAFLALGGADVSIQNISPSEWGVTATFRQSEIGDIQTQWRCRNQNGQNYVIGAGVRSADAEAFAMEIETAFSTCRLIASPAMRTFVEPTENAYRIILPDGWSWSGRIIRTLEIPGFFEWKAQSRDGLSGCFASPPGVFNMFQDFVSAEQAAEGIVLEGLSQQAENVRLTRVIHVPRAEEDFSIALRNVGMNPRVEKLRAEYSAVVNGEGILIQVDIVCLMPNASQFPDPRISGRGNWFLFTSGTWAPTSEFESVNSLAKGVLASHRTSLRWIIAQRPAVNDALIGRRGAMVEAFAGWDAFIRDMERVPDPDGGPIQEVPNRDGSVWKDPDGVMWRIPPGVDEQAMQNCGWQWIR